MQLKFGVIEHTVQLDASPEDVFSALLDPAKHSDFTGSLATTSRRTGARFTAWNGYISGKNIRLVKDKKIIQEWKTTEWPVGYPTSRLELTLVAKNGGTELKMVHSKVPAEQIEEYRKGWYDSYWNPLKKYFRKGESLSLARESEEKERQDYPAKADVVMISSELRQKFETLRQNIVASGSTNTLATNKAEVQLIKDQYSEAKVRGFNVVQDEPESIGGTGKGPTPTDYFIASVGFCENVIFVRNAALPGLSIDSLETTVTGSWDRRGLFEIDQVTPHFSAITVETKVSTRNPLERVVQVARETHRRCPVHATLARATEMIFRLVVNGQSVPI